MSEWISFVLGNFPWHTKHLYRKLLNLNYMHAYDTLTTNNIRVDYILYNIYYTCLLKCFVWPSRYNISFCCLLPLALALAWLKWMSIFLISVDMNYYSNYHCLLVIEWWLLSLTYMVEVELDDNWVDVKRFSFMHRTWWCNSLYNLIKAFTLKGHFWVSISRLVRCKWFQIMLYDFRNVCSCCLCEHHSLHLKKAHFIKENWCASFDREAHL